MEISTTLIAVISFALLLVKKSRILYILLNGHNIKIKNMTIPKNVQLEICDKYEELFDVKTTENSPVVGFAKDGVLNQQGAAGIWHGVRATEKTLSEFNWQLDDKVAHADASYDL